MDVIDKTKLAVMAGVLVIETACGAGKPNPQGSVQVPCSQPAGAVVGAAIPNAAGGVIIANSGQQNCAATVTPAPIPTAEICGSGEEIDVASAEADRNYIRENPFAKAALLKILELINKHIPTNKIGRPIPNTDLDNYVKGLLDTVEGTAVLGILLRILIKDTDLMKHLDDKLYCVLNNRASEGHRHGQQAVADGGRYDITTAAIAYELIKEAIERDTKAGNKDYLNMIKSDIQNQLYTPSMPIQTTATPARAAAPAKPTAVPAKPTAVPAKKSDNGATSQTMQGTTANWARNLTDAAYAQAPSSQVQYG